MTGYRTTLLIATAVIGLLAAYTPGQAQQRQGQGQGGGRGQRGAQQMQQMAERLGLTDAQKQKLKPLMEKQRGKMRGVMQDPNLSQEQKREKLQKIGKENDTEIKKILTPAQIKTYDEWQKQRRERMRQRQGAGQGGGGRQRGGGGQGGGTQ